MSRIIFFIVFVLALILVSFFTAKMYAVGFRFNGMMTKWSFFGFLLIPLLFVAGMITTRSAQTGMGPTLYTIIQIIAGFGFYLFIGAVVLGVVLIFTSLTGTMLPFWIPVFIFTLSLVGGIVGLIQAKHIVTTRYTVTLSGAPASWNGKTAALVTDTHFGLVNYTKFSDKVVSSILSLHPDFVLHGGDFYDGPAIDTAPITASWKKLTAQIPVFYAPGNHEAYGNYTAFVDSIRAADVTVLDDKKVEYNGIQIAGITYRDGKDNAEATAAIASLTLSDAPSILINHPPTALAAASAVGVDLMVSGHTHNGQFWPNTYLVRRVYGKFYYGLRQYEKMQVITSDGIGTFGPPFRLFNSPEIVLITFKTK